MIKILIITMLYILEYHINIKSYTNSDLYKLPSVQAHTHITPTTPYYVHDLYMYDHLPWLAFKIKIAEGMKAE